MRSARLPDRFGEVYFAMCKTLNTPRSLACWLLYKNKEFVQLVNRPYRPLDYQDQRHFEDDYLVTSFVKKFTGLETGIDLKGVAIQKFIASELKCARTNEDILRGRHRGFSPRVEAVLFTARRKIAAILGDFSLVKALSNPGWGPGATFDLKGSNATVVDKIGVSPISVTRRALPYLRAHLEADLHWFASWCPPGAEVLGPYSILPSCFRIVEGCRVTTVPKDARGDRTIAIEPTGNIFLQKAVGCYIRNRLKRFGVDLDSQRKNQLLASLAFRDELATIDLSSASDTVSKELVAELLPVDWFLLLDQIRSPSMKVEGSWLKLNKFSSMGNGFTFELETLIFYALTSSVCAIGGYGERIAVYGDDIICPSKAYHDLVEVLEICGFSVNSEKSFSSGYFYESCGKHYWGGKDVTPVFQKDPPSSLSEGYRLANRIIRLSLRRGNGLVLDGALYPAYQAALRCLKDLGGPRHFVPLYPLHLSSKEGDGDDSDYNSDDGLALVKQELVRHFRTSKRGKRFFLWEGYILPVLSFKPKFRRKGLNELAMLAYTLRFNPEMPFEGAVPLRRRGEFRSTTRFFPLGAADVAWF